MTTTFTPGEKAELIEFYGLKNFTVEFLETEIKLTKNGRSQTITNEKMKKLTNIFTKN